MPTNPTTETGRRPTTFTALPGRSEAPSDESAPASPEACFRRILLPVDLSGTSARLLRIAAALARRVGAEVRLFYVLGLYERDSTGGKGPRSTFRSEVPDAVEQRLWSWAKEQVPGSLAMSAVGETGVPDADVLARVAEREQCDLVVVGCQPVPAWRRFLDGQVAVALVNRGRTAVLAVPARMLGEPHSEYRSTPGKNSKKLA